MGNYTYEKHIQTRFGSFAIFAGGCSVLNIGWYTSISTNFLDFASNWYGKSELFLIWTEMNKYISMKAKYQAKF